MHVCNFATHFPPKTFQSTCYIMDYISGSEYLALYCIPMCAGARAAFGRIFPPGNGFIFLDNVQCEGDEPNITSCTFFDRHDCRHLEDAGVLCEG